MRTLTNQRNHLIHRLYDLFAARIDERLMSRDELEDLSLMEERAWVLEENLNGFVDAVEGRITQLQNGERANVRTL